MNNPISLFENPANNTSNSLKEFLYYLKFYGKKGVIDFTYSNEFDSLHKSMTIKENLLLDSIPISLIKDNDLNLKEFIQAVNNPELTIIVEKLGSLDQTVSELCPQYLKLTSLIKAILSKREYIFLVNPDKNLSIEQLDRLKRCLVFEATQNQRKIYIKSAKPDSWLDIASIIISKNSQFKFQQKENPFLQLPTPKIKLVA